MTGAKRVRGTSIARAPSNAPIAAPMAVSSCTTSGLSGARVDALAVDDQRQVETPSPASSRSRSARSPTHRLFELKKRQRRKSRNDSGSSSALGGLTEHEPPVRARRAMWPPLRSASVPATTSIANGTPSAAHQAARCGSATAPRLSAFETNA